MMMMMMMMRMMVEVFHELGAYNFYVFRRGLSKKEKSKTIPVTSSGSLYGCEMLRFPHC
jgi:hypothetical protein